MDRFLDDYSPAKHHCFFKGQPVMDDVSLALYNDLRSQKKFYNVEFYFGKEIIYCHREIAEAGSTHMKEILADSKMEFDMRMVIVDEKLVDRDHFPLIISYLYTSIIVFTPQNIRHVLQAAHYFRLTALHDAAETYLLSLFKQIHYDSELLNFKSRWTGQKSDLFRYYRPLSTARTGGALDFDTNLNVFKKNRHFQMVYKSVEGCWIFVDSLQHCSTEYFQTSAVYISNDQYMILQGDVSVPGRTVMKRAAGDLYYSKTIANNLYIYGSGLLEHRRYNFAAKEMFRLSTMAGGITLPIRDISIKLNKIYVTDSRNVQAYNPESDSWENFTVPQPSAPKKKRTCAQAQARVSGSKASRRRTIRNSCIL